jgi:hypothetical protein
MQRRRGTYILGRLVGHHCNVRYCPTVYSSGIVFPGLYHRIIEFLVGGNFWRDPGIHNRGDSLSNVLLLEFYTKSLGFYMAH